MSIDNLDIIKRLIAEKECGRVEFKETTGQLERGMETLCAFLNGEGGTVLFGVTDKGKIIGQDVSDKTKRDIADAIRRIEPFATVEVSNSENLKSLQKIVADPDNTVRLYGLVEQYDFLSVNNEKKTKIFEAPNRQNLYRELMESFSGDESMKAKYSETLIQQGIVDEYELTGNLGATLRPKKLTNVFPAGQMSMSNDVEIYISCKGTTTLEQVKTLGHELYGHTLFGISGLDPRHGGNTGRPDGNPTLEKQIIKSEMESEKNYNQ